ncbi:MAG: small multi-drug export protein, partial [Clostridiales bacterium]|nr:small multi-drug export protein [Clostridiales bacterium]
MNAIVEFFKTAFSNAGLTTFFISMLPIIELKGAIPWGIGWGVKWYNAFFLAFAGSCFPAPFILWLLNPLFN